MTEKRFTYMEQFNGFYDVYDNGKILSCMRLEYVDKTVDLLNEQHEQIQVLKASNGEMEDYLARLEEENWQLKNQRYDLYIDIARLFEKNEKLNQSILSTSKELQNGVKKVQKLAKENEELKQFINELTSRDGRIWLSSGYVYDVKKVLKGDVE